MIKRQIAQLLTACALTACADVPVLVKEPWQAVSRVPRERPICGWEELNEAMDRVELPGNEAAPGTAVLVILPADDVPYGVVRSALAPAAAALVRVKIAVDRRWLLATTYPPADPPPKPPPERAVTRVVGERQITRDVEAPALRFADVRVDGDAAQVFVENDAPAGETIPLGALAAALAEIEPPAEVFAVTATSETAWANVRRAVIASACYDRAPGDEPHEVILD
jgi:hypothetical protein